MSQPKLTLEEKQSVLDQLLAVLAALSPMRSLSQDAGLLADTAASALQDEPDGYGFCLLLRRESIDGKRRGTSIDCFLVDPEKAEQVRAVAGRSEVEESNN